MHNDMIHSMTGFAGAILAWIAGKFTAVQEFIPASWWQGGVTVVFLSCLIYAVVHLNKALREERDARLRDRDEMEELLKEDLKATRESREKLNQVIDRNSASLDNLAEKIGSPTKHTHRIKLRNDA